MIELLWAQLADGRLALCDYPKALERFLAYIVKTNLAERGVHRLLLGERDPGPVERRRRSPRPGQRRQQRRPAVRHGDRSDSRLHPEGPRRSDRSPFRPPHQGSGARLWRVILGPTFKG